MQTCENGILHERFADKYLALWPSAIETVPFLHHTPGGRYLLLSTLGCNLSCPGCVSHMLVDDPDLIAGALLKANPDDILKQVREHCCLGVIFCLNEPSVSFQTLIHTAKTLKKEGLLVGCASNGCMEQPILRQLLPYLDMINIGMKGLSDDVYRTCGSPCDVEQVLNSIRIIHEAQVHLEISVVFEAGREHEITDLARHLSHISAEIPLHVMRFIPFNGADDQCEPAPEDAEMIVSRCKTWLNWVYLFNTPGTCNLSSYCPDCGSLLIERTFYGPMGARLTNRIYQQECTCGRTIPVFGEYYKNDGYEPRFRGGYRTSVLLDMVSGTLYQLGICDKMVVSRVLVQILSGDWLEKLQTFFATPEGYIEYIRTLGLLADAQDLVHPLLGFYTERLEQITKSVANIRHPRVFCALSHPYLASYPDKMEVALAARAGGSVLNYQIAYTESRPHPLSREEFMSLQPEVILCLGMGKSDTSDFLHHCQNEGLLAPAIETGQIYCIPKQYPVSGVRWVLALEYIANLLHPEVIRFSLEDDERYLNTLLYDIQTNQKSIRI
ncbi:MAG TPA: radical SAM protein [Methanospirillum sp.]|uniref:radical SAM protein n=1 Tax=Methanospirillum sp. TaxID=45200 RepID=UPI002C9EB667|nr:radical SAM protein [Methanospirillum sp.]HWQ63317.1 radical SAM protein [Methanospirillum sp.]